MEEIAANVCSSYAIHHPVQNLNAGQLLSLPSCYKSATESIAAARCRDTAEEHHEECEGHEDPAGAMSMIFPQKYVNAPDNPSEGLERVELAAIREVIAAPGRKTVHG